MGTFISKILQKILEKIWDFLIGVKRVRALMIGLDEAGKTTILYKLKLGEVVSTIPTIGFNVEEIRYKRNLLTIWDVGGIEKIRVLWRHYLANTQALIFVINSNDRERLKEANTELKKILANEELTNASLLIYANKQDLSGVVSAYEITEKLDLHSIKTHQWHVQPSCALTGEGLYEGLDWISKNLV